MGARKHRERVRESKFIGPSGLFLISSYLTAPWLLPVWGGRTSSPSARNEAAAEAAARGGGGQQGAAGAERLHGAAAAAPAAGGGADPLRGADGSRRAERGTARFGVRGGDQGLGLPPFGFEDWGKEGGREGKGRKEEMKEGRREARKEGRKGGREEGRKRPFPSKRNPSLRGGRSISTKGGKKTPLRRMGGPGVWFCLCVKVLLGGWVGGFGFWWTCGLIAVLQGGKGNSVETRDFSWT